MKVIKVIVDKFPDGCWLCGYCKWHYCVARTYFKEISDSYHRPDWCPLEVEEEKANE